MKKIIVCLIAIILSTSGIFGYYKINNSTKTDNKKEIEISTITNEEKIEEEKASDIKDEDQNKEVSSNVVEEETKTVKENKSNTSNNTSNSKKTIVKENVVVEEPKKEVIEEKKNEPIKEEKHPWDDLGISENDYYNKPMWSWMKIDFDINSYGTQAATENACREYGNKKAEEEGLGFSCTNVLSYSGKYLGEYIKFF